MAICRDEDRLFVFAAAPSEAHWEWSRQDPILERWDRRMAEFLETNENGQLLFTLLPKAFGFGEFR
ncbi:MAG TPA: hypothetical protein VHU84_12605 [Lacipirellulaceae bacterium]|jgi:hypothetical protein|nr:hypothetical protein [Lacipirellulaceae bacterium]